MTGRRSRIPNHCKSQKNRRHALRLHLLGNPGTCLTLDREPRNAERERHCLPREEPTILFSPHSFKSFSFNCNRACAQTEHCKTIPVFQYGCHSLFQPPTVWLTSAHYSWEYFLSKLLGFSHLHAPTLFPVPVLNNLERTTGALQTPASTCRITTWPQCFLLLPSKESETGIQEFIYKHS